ncbi:formamidase [Mycolicibacterium sp. XJ879]
MPDVIFSLDPDKRFDEQDVLGHSRWHPEIPPVASVRPGQTFRVHCRGWFDGSIGNTDSADDILNAPFHEGHKLSGPFAVDGAKPGDLLVVDIVDIGPISEGDVGPLAGQGWGYTGIFAPRNGGGFLGDLFPDAYKAVWEFSDGHATSRHIPGVKFAGAPHPGLMGTAPSSQLLTTWNKREAKLIATKPVRVPPLALPPMAKGALLGQTAEQDVARLAVVAAQTAPPRENGGNQDIKDLTKGSRIFYPVFVDGANLSVGDLHFSQGDGEITFCGAIEMGGYIDLHVDVIADGMSLYKIRENPLFVPGGAGTQCDEWLTFSGISVTRDGKQTFLDPFVAYQRACLNAIDYLTAFGYSREQAYLLLGAAPIEGHLSSVVDIPNTCATVYLPTAIFDFDVKPRAEGPHQVVSTVAVPRSDASGLPEDSVLRAVPKDKRSLLPTAQQLGGRAARPIRNAMRKLLG